MPLHILSHAPYFNTSFKNQLFKGLAERLRETWTDEDKFLALVGNVFVQGKFFDAILISQSTVCIIDFQDYGGRIEPRKTGNWRAGRNIIVGNNPYITLESNIKLLGQALYHIRAINGMQGLVLFNQPIVYTEKSSPISDSWFHISDIQGIAIERKLINGGLEDFSEDEIKEILIHLGVKREEVNDLIIAPKTVELESHLINEIITPHTLVNSNTLLVDDAIAKEALDSYTLGIMYIDFNFNKAIECFTKAIEIHPHYPAAYCARAYALIKAEKLDDALNDCDVALEQEWEFGLAHFLKGTIHLLQEEYKEAEFDFYSASFYVEKTITDETFHYEWINTVFLEGVCLQKTGHHINAIEKFTEIIDSEPSNNTKLYSALEHRAISYIAEKRFDDAIMDLDSVIGNSFDYQTPVFINRGICYKNLGEYETAISDYTQHISSNPEDVTGYYERAECSKTLLEENLKAANKDSIIYIEELDSEQQKLYTDIISDYNKVIENDNNYAAAYYGLAEINFILWKNSDGLTNRDDSLPFLVTAYELAPHNQAYWEGLKCCYAYIFTSVISGIHERFALEYIDKLINSEHCNNSSQVYLARGFIYAQNGLYELALNDFNQAINLNGIYPSHFLHDEKELYKVYQDLFDPSDYPNPFEQDFIKHAYYNRAVLNEYFKNYEQAVADYVTAASLPLNEEDEWLELRLEELDGYEDQEPETAEEYYQTGRCRYANGDLESVTELFVKAMEDDASYIELIENYKSFKDKNSNLISEQYHFRAWSKLIEKDYKGAIKDTTKALTFNNVDIHTINEILNTRAEAYINIKEYALAIADYTELIKLDYFLDDFYEARGDAYMYLKDYQKAIVDYTEIISKCIEVSKEEDNEYEPSYILALFEKRAKCHELLGNRFSAQKDYQKASELRMQS